MLIRKLTIEGFKPFQDRIEFDFSVPEDSTKNIVLIGGMNGGGKTSLLEAINLCLYGAKNRVIFNCFNKNAVAEQQYKIDISLSFQDSSDIVEIRRRYFIQTKGRNPQYSLLSQKQSKGSSPQYSDIQQSLSMSFNEEEVDDPTRNVQEELDQFLALKIPKNISPFFFFDGEKIQDIVDTGFSREDIRESVEALLGIEVLKKLHEDLKKLISEERKSYKNVSNQSIRVREAELEDKQQQLKDKEQDQTGIEKEVSELEEQIEQLKGEFKEQFGRFPEMIKEKERLEMDAKSLSKENSRLVEKLNEFYRADLPLLLLTPLIPQLKEAIHKEQEMKRRQGSNEEKSQLVHLIIEQLFSDECAVCKHPIQSQKEELFQTVSDRIFQSSQDDEERIFDLSDKEEMRIFGIQEEENYRKILDFKEMLDRQKLITKQSQSIKRGLSSLELESEEQVNFEALLKEISSLEKLFGRRKEERSNIRENKHSLKKEIETKEHDLNKFYEQHEKQKESNDFVSYATKLCGVIEGYIEFYRIKKVKELQHNFSYIFSAIFAKRHLVHEILIHEKTFNITLKDAKKERIDHKSFSAGEQEIFAISFLWALSQTSHLELPIIIDTPLARLDHVYRQNLAHHYFPHASKQVIILSQDQEVEPEGKLHDSLKPSIYLEKTLQYDEIHNKTVVHDGYFTA